nr:MAG TPA: transposase-like protein [Caudoviricetes sp.]
MIMNPINVVEFMKALREGKEKICPACGKGKIIADGEPSTALYFSCSNKDCRFRIIVN